MLRFGGFQGFVSPSEYRQSAQPHCRLCQMFDLTERFVHPACLLCYPPRQKCVLSSPSAVKSLG
nr:MAG TPA: hypothetical protein [Caudoviricetes sp.]